MRKRKKTLLWVVAFLLLCAIGFAVYVGDYYKAEPYTAEILEQSNVTLMPDMIVFAPKQQAIAGLIFYPGGKVESEAYAPLMAELADAGVLCVLMKMPYRLAVLDSDAAEGVRDTFPQVKNWYMAGHSLGGAMAASYIGSHADEYDGLILLAAYSTADLSDSDLDVLCVYGSEDGVLKMKAYESNKKNLPSDFVEQVIYGGCHAYFGAYGAQDGDGEPYISAFDQRALTVAAIVELIDAA